MPATNYQHGILEQPPEHVLVAALSFGAPDVSSCQAAFQALRELVRRELAADISEIDPDSNPAVSTADTGELGVDTGYDTTQLSVTVGVSASGFQRLGVAASELPQDLIPINWDWFSDSPVNQSEGDLVLQICADSSYVVEHVLRRIEHEQAAAFTVIWTLSGEQRNGGNHGAPLTADTARALIGFHDGLSNLDPNNPADQQLIFVSQDGGRRTPNPQKANSQALSQGSPATASLGRADRSSRATSASRRRRRNLAGPPTALT